MRFALLLMLMLLTCPDLSTAETPPLDRRESLRELPGVEVVIEPISPEAQADGLTTESVQTAVELILRSSGIKLLTPSETKDTTSAPILYTSITALRRDSLYALSAYVQLEQQTSLVHRPQLRLYTPTWRRGLVILASKNKIRDLISNHIEPLIKEFANDFLAVNPR